MAVPDFPCFMTGPFYGGRYRPGHAWMHGYPSAAVLPQEEGGWTIVRGAVERISDLELAWLAGDERLAQQIEERRFWRKLGWGLGFGAVGAAGIGSGVYLYRGKGRDRRAAGISLITLGAANTVMALIFSLADRHHVLRPSEAAELCDRHNEQLRRQLGLKPRDVAPLLAPPGP